MFHNIISKLVPLRVRVLRTSACFQSQLPFSLHHFVHLGYNRPHSHLFTHFVRCFCSQSAMCSISVHSILLLTFLLTVSIALASSNEELVVEDAEVRDIEVGVVDLSKFRYIRKMLLRVSLPENLAKTLLTIIL